MTKRALAVLLLIFSIECRGLAQSTASSAEPSIWIGMTLHLGMARDTIIPKLTESYRLTKIQVGDDEWIIAEKNSPETWVGHLGFHGGKLTYASRWWTQEGEDKLAFAQALWGVMSQMQSEGQHSCSFDVPITRSPTSEMRNVRLYCGAKRVEILITNVLSGEGKGQQVSIREVLSSESAR